MARITRRKIFKLSAAGAVAAQTGGLAAILATGRAPAFAQGTTIHWVRGSDYVPVSDQLIKTKLNEQVQKDLGLKINLEGVDGLTLQARVTSSVQSGSGPDIICALNNWAQLYADSVADISDVAEEIGKAQGGYYETSKAIAYDGKTVVLNSKETIESVKFAVGLWKDACDEGALAWDDSGNNRAFLAGTISATNNGAPIHLEAKKKASRQLSDRWQEPMAGRASKPVRSAE